MNLKGILTRNNKTVLREDAVETAWQQIHQHAGRDKTWAKFNKRFYWHGGSLEVRERVHDCVACRQKNAYIHRASVAPLKPIPVLPLIFWRIHLDMSGKLMVHKPKKNQYFIISVDAFTKYVEGKGN